jgi:hypothetical protein
LGLIFACRENLPGLPVEIAASGILFATGAVALTSKAGFSSNAGREANGLDSSD